MNSYEIELQEDLERTRRILRRARERGQHEMAIVFARQEQECMLRIIAAHLARQALHRELVQC